MKKKLRILLFSAFIICGFGFYSAFGGYNELTHAGNGQGEPEALKNYEDQYCKSGKTGCCSDYQKSCETGIKCESGGC